MFALLFTMLFQRVLRAMYKNVAGEEEMESKQNVFCIIHIMIEKEMTISFAQIKIVRKIERMKIFMLFIVS